MGFTRAAREAARIHNIDILEFDDLKQRLDQVKPLALEQARKAVEADGAHALKKTNILIARKGESIPFDLQSVNFIFYKSIVDLRERLEQRIKGTVLQSGEVSGGAGLPKKSPGIASA